MCLVTRQIKPITTKKDLIVYKDVKILIDPETKIKEIKSHYFYFIWVKGFVNKTDIVMSRQFPVDSENNDNICPTNPFFDTIAHKFYEKDTHKYSVIKNGFHAALTKRRLFNYQYSRTKFLIPKGSLIFKDATGLIVSNQMMLL